MLVRGFRFSPFHCSSQHTLSYQTLLSLKRSFKSFNANINPVEWSYFSHFPEEKMPGLRVVGVIGSVSVKKPQLSLAGVQTQACVSVKPAPFVSVCFYIIVFLGLMLIIKPWLQSSVYLSIHQSHVYRSINHLSIHPSIRLSVYLPIPSVSS